MYSTVSYTYTSHVYKQGYKNDCQYGAGKEKAFSLDDKEQEGVNKRIEEMETKEERERERKRNPEERLSV